MPLLYLMHFAMQKIIYQKPLLGLLLISTILCELNAFAHETESSLGTFMTKSPESTDAPPGDEVQLQCELNLPPDKLEFRFRPQNSSPEDRDQLVNIHEMVRNSLFSLHWHWYDLSRLHSLATISRQKIVFLSSTCSWIRRQSGITGAWLGLGPQHMRRYRRNFD